MLELIRKELQQRSYLSLTTVEDWAQWHDVYTKSDAPTQDALIKLLANHTGIAMSEVQGALVSMTPALFVVFQVQEQNNSVRIQQFLQREFAKLHDISKLEISRSEWLAIINKFEAKQRQNVDINFIIRRLSLLRRVSFDSLLELITKHSPRAGIKRTRFVRDGESDSSQASSPSFSDDDDEPNPLIANSAQVTTDMQEALEATGVRSTELIPATPERGYPELQYTPGGRKARPVCFLDKFGLFKHLTPFSTKPEEARADFRAASAKAISFQLPELTTKRAEAVEFTATLEAIKERAGKRRRESQGSIMGASARDVFIAHGIEINYEHKNAHHWAHLIAHFLCDTSEIHTESDEEEVINLVASTAAANYNTLKMVEVFIRNKLMSEATEELHIRVEPSFSGQALIPDLLTYTLRWNEENEHGMVCEREHIFYINPQSYERVNRSMLESINALRKVTSVLSGPDEGLSDLFLPIGPK